MCVGNKYGIRKRERPQTDNDPGLEGRIGRTVNAGTSRDKQQDEDDPSQTTDAPCKRTLTPSLPDRKRYHTTEISGNSQYRR